MNCNDTRQWIHGYADRELDLVHTVEIEHHLRDCPSCTRAYQNLQALRGALGADALRFQAPAALRQRIQSGLRTASPARPATAAWPARRVLSWRWAAVAASLALVAVLSWGTFHILSLPSAEEFLVKEVVASHIRSVQTVGHELDVKSSNKHAVKPWFEGKVDFSPEVKDWKDQDFRLLGGRLDYFNERPVAVLVYKRRQHLINLFIWREGPVSDNDPQILERQGYHLVHWTKAGLAYWAVSNLNPTELEEFVRLARR